MSNEQLMVSEPSQITHQKEPSETQRIQSAMIIAKRFLRSEETALTKIRKQCTRQSFAKIALFSYPRKGERGKQTISGGTIRMAEAMAQAWGNLDWGVREIEHISGYDGRSLVEGFCWDLETNSRLSRTMTVHHKRKARDKIQHLTDPRDISELVNNYGSRMMREMVFRTIPRDVYDQALEDVRKTLLSSGADIPIEDRIRAMVFEFDKLGVSNEILERRLKHKTSLCNVEELVELQGIYNGLKEGSTNRWDWFDLSSEPTGGKADEITELGNKEGTHNASKK